MSFWQAVQTCFQKYFDFSGRASVGEFSGFLGFVAAFIALCTYSSIIFQLGYNPLQIILYISVLAIVIPSLSVSWRRLHDINRSGWWSILMLVLTLTGIPSFLFGIIAIAAGMTDVAILAGIGILAGGLGLAWSIMWLTASGDKGENQYGPDPRATY